LETVKTPSTREIRPMKITVEMPSGYRETPLDLANLVENILRNSMGSMLIQVKGKPAGITQREGRLITVVKVEE
jgi:hypothetical protein